MNALAHDRVRSGNVTSSGKARRDSWKGEGQSAEETLVLDARSSLGPAQQVEHKLIMLMGALPVSNVRLTALNRGRRHC